MNTKIKDFRSGYSTSLEINGHKVLFLGSSIESLIKDTTRGQYIYNIIQHGYNVGSIAIKDADKKEIDNYLSPIEFTRINSDVNGNSRYVCHFLAFINEGDRVKSDTKGIGFVSEEYEIALKKAKDLGGRKFHNKQYGGGIVFQMYDSQQLEMSLKIRELAKVNTVFTQDWQPFQKVYNKVKRAIYSHFLHYTYKWQPTHDKESRKDFNPFSFDEIDNLLGLAYTSSSAYAALWVCNSGYLMANETHHFIGFAVNKLGQVIGITQDENENEILIEL